MRLFQLYDCYGEETGLYSGNVSENELVNNILIGYQRHITEGYEELDELDSILNENNIERVFVAEVWA